MKKINHFEKAEKCVESISTNTASNLIILKTVKGEIANYSPKKGLEISFGSSLGVGNNDLDIQPLSSPLFIPLFQVGKFSNYYDSSSFITINGEAYSYGRF